MTAAHPRVSSSSSSSVVVRASASLSGNDCGGHGGGHCGVVRVAGDAAAVKGDETRGQRVGGGDFGDITLLSRRKTAIKEAK